MTSSRLRQQRGWQPVSVLSLKETTSMPFLPAARRDLMKLNVSMLSFLIPSLLLGVQMAHAEEGQRHLYEAAQADPALKSAFEKITAPVVKESSWLSHYGTTAPPTIETVD